MAATSGAPSILPRPRTNAALVLVAACAATFVGFGSLLIYSFSVFLKPLSETFGWSRSEISIAFSITAIMIAVASPVLGRLLDRYPARNIIIPCVVVYASGFASMGLLTRHIWHLWVLFALMGAVGNGTCQLAFARVLGTWFDRGRGRAFAALMAGSGLGSIVFPPLTQFLISAIGWRAAYGVLGVVVALVALPLTAVFVYEREGTAAPEPCDPHTSRETPARVWTFAFLGLIAATMLFSVAENGLASQLSALLTDRALSAQRAATVIAIMGAATLVSKLTTGYLMDRFPANKVVALLFVVTSFGVALLAAEGGVWLPYLAAAMMGVGFGAQSDVVPFLLTRYFGLAGFSELYGYTWTAYAAAAAAGPIFMAQIFDRTHSYGIAVGTLAAFTGLASLTMAMLPRYERISLAKSQ